MLEHTQNQNHKIFKNPYYKLYVVVAMSRGNSGLKIIFMLANENSPVGLHLET